MSSSEFETIHDDSEAHGDFVTNSQWANLLEARFVEVHQALRENEGDPIQLRDELVRIESLYFDRCRVSLLNKFGRVYQLKHSL